MRNWNPLRLFIRTGMFMSFDRTYEELKHFFAILVYLRGPVRFDRTYEELKHRLVPA